MNLRFSDVDSSAGSLAHYSRSLQRLIRVAEERGPYKPFERKPERLVAAIWFDQKLDHARLHTVDERPLTVLSPGRWNEGPGPDFLEAQLQFSGRKTVVGDVEVEVFASDWDRHKHRSSADFGSVILKVCLWNDIRTPRKSAIPLLELFPYLADEHQLELQSTEGYPFASPTMQGRCTPFHNHGRIDQTLRFVASAGDRRISQKAQRLTALMRTFGADQTLYKGLMEAAGYSANKEPMSRLADAVHLEFIRSVLATVPQTRRREAILALFYGAGGLFARIPSAQQPPYIKRLRETWEDIRVRHPTVEVEGFRLAQVRPVNSPWRRMTAVSKLLADIPGLRLFDYVQAALAPTEDYSSKAMKAAVKRITGLFTGLSDPFWDRRLSPSGEEQERSYKLIGDNLAAIITANIIAPLTLAHARRTRNRSLEAFVRELFTHLGGQQHNAVTRFVCARLFGPDATEPAFARNARLHQGLIQIYHDFCRTLRQGCPDCRLIEFLEAEED